MAKQQLFQTLLENTALELAIVDSSDEEAEDEIFNECEEIVAVLSGIRYTYRGNVPKNLNWFDETLQNLDDKRFKTLLRCSPIQFNTILALIEKHPVFHGENCEKQFTVQFQLALVLYRLRSNGHGATLAKIASLFGVGDGGTIEKVTRRVFESILSLEKNFLEWPSDEERNNLVFATFNELPHCFGYLDGTEIPLRDAPGWDHTAYYSRNKQYSIKMQAVCDFTLRFRQVTIGYPGSVHDARIFNNCRLATHSQLYFSGEENLAADSAYKLLTTVMTPFRKNATALTPEKRAKFNKYFSSFRARVEHLFGHVKERFPSLYELSIRVWNEASHKYACDWILVCCILHSILLPHFDEENYTSMADYSNRARSGDTEDEDDEDNDIDELAEAKRIALAELLSIS